ncbi:MAG: hypothetical protein AAFQ82_24970, partial [Myxococcota bacterium]
MRYSVLLVLPLLFASTPVLAQEEIQATPTSDESAPAAEPETEPAPAPTPAGRSPIDGVVGHLGFGYFTGDAPLGVRYWLDRDTAIDIGVDLAFSSGDAEALRYAIEAGYVMNLAHYHYSVVFARAGVGIRSVDILGDGINPIYNLNANGFLGAELFLGAFGFPNVSLQG